MAPRDGLDRTSRFLPRHNYNAFTDCVRQDAGAAQSMMVRSVKFTVEKVLLLISAFFLMARLVFGYGLAAGKYQIWSWGLLFIISVHGNGGVRGAPCFRTLFPWGEGSFRPKYSVSRRHGPAYDKCNSLCLVTGGN